MNIFETDLGRRLYDLLPAVYRSRDNGDLATYLDGCGRLLDLLEQTLRQRLADCFPDNPPDGEPPCQDWILPYFAKLLDVRLVSPEAHGRREELGNAIGWRQRKGTLTSVEQVAEAVGQMEVEVQEGWRRVAVTPRVGLPLLAPRAHGYDGEAAREADGLFTHPTLGARHPGLPAATVDLRCPTRAVRTSADNPAAKQTRFGTDADPVPWRQASLHGTPCFSGSFDDVSRRTVDLRTPDWRRGHVHPRRLLLFAPPPGTFFAPDPSSVVWDTRHLPKNEGLFEEADDEGGYLFRGLTDRPLRIRGVVELHAAKTHVFDNVQFENSLIVHQGRLHLYHSAARRVELHAIDTEEPLLVARACLLRRAQAARGLVRLEYCTVLDLLLAEVLEASDCIFTGPLRRDHEGPEPPRAGCVRYSRIPPALAADPLALPLLVGRGNTSRAPVFFTGSYGDFGCGVLHPATPAAIRFGAEDGGEMGAYHDLQYSRRAAALLEKLKDFLPVGIEAVLSYDQRLREVPPEV